MECLGKVSSLNTSTEQVGNGKFGSCIKKNPLKEWRRPKERGFIPSKILYAM